jgi:hypothetical protein
MRPIVLSGFMATGKSTVGPRLAARLDVPAVLWNLPTTRAGELMPRFPILPWAPGGPYHRREILKPGGEANGTPKPEVPWPA